jgi:hypothetical protein
MSKLKLKKEKISRKYLSSIYIKPVLLKKKIINVDLNFLRKITATNSIEISNLLKYKIKKSSLNFSFLKEESENKFNIKLLKIILSKKLSISSQKKKSTWNKGWSENLRKFKEKDISTLYPGYFRKKNYFFRYKGRVIYSKCEKFEILFSEFIHAMIIKKYIKNINNLYEFGAGSGKIISSLMINLEEKISYYASDWVENAVKLLGKIKINNKTINNFKFDFFNPSKVRIKKNSIVFTGGALEQTGSNYEKFVDYLIKQKPEFVINFEPFDDIYTNENLNDLVLKLYAKKRNYLSGYIHYLKKLENLKKIKIIEIKRIFGGPYHEGYSFLCWKIL